MVGVPIETQETTVSRAQAVQAGVGSILHWIRLKALLAFSVFTLVVLVFAAVTANWISPHDPRRGDLDDKNTPPVWMSDVTVQKTIVAGFPKNQVSEISIARASNLSISGRIFTLDGIMLDPDTVELDMEIMETIRPDGIAKFLLGTDHQGRDLLSRIIHGARISLIVAGVTLIVGGGVGITLGLLAGYYGGIIDEIIMRMVDVALALPLVLVALVLVIALGRFEVPVLPMGEVHLIVMILSLFLWVRFARQVRGEVLSLKNADYVALAKVAGCSTKRILAVHLFPGVLNTLIVLATLQVSVVILIESVLSFLGAGVAPPTPAWGSMVSDGRDFLRTAPWVSTIPGLALLFTVLAFNLIGDWIRDALDPRLRHQIQ